MLLVMADQNKNGADSVPASERYQSPQQIAEELALDIKTVRRLFADEPGVISIDRAATGRGSRAGGRKTLRIPISVKERVLRRLGGAA